MRDDPRVALAAAVAAAPDESLASLSRLIGRNEAYLQQYLYRGTPRVLAERDRRVLARYLGLDEAALGGPDSSAVSGVSVPRLRAVAAAGAGGVADDAVVGAIHFDPRSLQALGVRGQALSAIEAIGDSMEPLIRHGDTMLVDTADRRVPRGGGVFVLRLGDALLVKRVTVTRGALTIVSDNPAAPAIPADDAARAELIGRVVWLGRALT